MNASKRFFCFLNEKDRTRQTTRAKIKSFTHIHSQFLFWKLIMWLTDLPLAIFGAFGYNVIRIFETFKMDSFHQYMLTYFYSGILEKDSVPALLWLHGTLIGIYIEL